MTKICDILMSSMTLLPKFIGKVFLGVYLVYLVYL